MAVREAVCGKKQKAKLVALGHSKRAAVRCESCPVAGTPCVKTNSAGFLWPDGETRVTFKTKRRGSRGPVRQVETACWDLWTVCGFHGNRLILIPTTIPFLRFLTITFSTLRARILELPTYDTMKRFEPKPKLLRTFFTSLLQLGFYLSILLKLLIHLFVWFILLFSFITYLLCSFPLSFFPLLPFFLHYFLASFLPSFFLFFLPSLPPSFPPNDKRTPSLYSFFFSWTCFYFSKFTLHHIQGNKKFKHSQYYYFTITRSDRYYSRCWLFQLLLHSFTHWIFTTSENLLPPLGNFRARILEFVILCINHSSIKVPEGNLLIEFNFFFTAWSSSGPESPLYFLSFTYSEFFNERQNKF